MLPFGRSIGAARGGHVESILVVPPPVALVALTTLLMGAGAILWAVDKSNDISAERQLLTTQASIRAAVQELAQQQEMVAIWDDAVVELSESSLDLKWIDANFGVWLNKTFGQDEIYILDDRNEPLVATVGDTRVPAHEYERVRASVSDLVAGIRGVPDSLHRAHVADLATASYLKTGQAVHDAHLLELNGRPAAVSVMKIIRADLQGGNSGAARPVERILAASNQPYEVLDNQVFVGTSIGLVLAPEAGLDRIELLRKADIALYRAKGEGRNCYRLFTPEMDETVNISRIIEEDLHAALATGEGLGVAYQPQIAQGGPIVGVEALARWRHPTRGPIQPSQFISVAEQTGLIVPLGEWILRQACMASRRWPDLFVSINLSSVQFRSSDFAGRLIAVVRECGGHPQRVELEVTESVLLREDDGCSAEIAGSRLPHRLG